MKPPLRSKARSYALQAIYQWALTGHEIDELKEQYEQNSANDKIDKDYFIRLVEGVVIHHAEIDQQFQAFLDRKIDQLTPIEIAVLRLATFELQYCLDVPHKVIINEALELTKTFGSTDDGFKYINGVLDRVARKLRQAEF